MRSVGDRARRDVPSELNYEVHQSIFCLWVCVGRRRQQIVASIAEDRDFDEHGNIISIIGHPLLQPRTVVPDKFLASVRLRHIRLDAMGTQHCISLHLPICVVRRKRDGKQDQLFG